MNMLKMKMRRREEDEEMLKRLGVGGPPLDIVGMCNLMVLFKKKIKRLMLIKLMRSLMDCLQC